MADTLAIGDLPSEAQRELLDFYDFLKAKHSKPASDEITPASDPYLLKKVKVDTTNIHFTRDEMHERG